MSGSCRRPFPRRDDGIEFHIRAVPGGLVSSAIVNETTDGG